MDRHFVITEAQRDAITLLLRVGSAAVCRTPDNAHLCDDALQARDLADELDALEPTNIVFLTDGERTTP